MCPRALKKKPQTSNQTTRIAKLWILLVGVNQYQDAELPSLQYSALDCQGLGEALTEAIDIRREITLHHDFADNKPTLKTVGASLQRIISFAQSEDTILFYFSGHGILDTATQQVYLCLADTQKQQLATTALPLNTILRLLGKCQASQQLVWLDACHSGGMTFRGTTKISLPNPTTQLVQVLRQKAQQSQGFYGLLSCDQNQQSWEFPELGHGVFTYYLMRGLRGEAADSHGIIEADGLYQYVYHQTLRYIDRSNQQIRLINQQKSSRGERQLQSEYPLQTPKRIVEGFGKVVIGKRQVKIRSSLPRQALIIDGLGTNQTTLDLSKVLRGRGSFNLEYFPPSNQKWTDVKAAIESCLNTAAISESETTTALLYLRGRIKYGKAGEAWLVFRDGAYISREWLRKILHQSPVTQQIVILDCPDAAGIAEWIEDLKLEYERGQCILSYQEKIKVSRKNLQQFSNALVSTLQQSDPETGLSIATWISQLQVELAPSNIVPQIWLSGTRGVIEVLPEKNQQHRHKDDSTILDINVCPYMGLQAFNENNAQYFYGREALVQKLINQLNHQPTLAVVGASGSGKSSVVQAGVFYQLSLGKQIPGSDRWMLKWFRPGTNPFQSLAKCLINYGTPKQQARQQLQIEGLLYQGADVFIPWLRTRTEPMVVLAVDQFEELFTLTGETDRAQFIQLLLKIIEYAGDRLRLIFVVRADFVAACLEIPELSPILQQTSVLVPPYLTESDYRNAIIKPATQVGLKVEPGLVEVLLQELNGATGDLPLLQFVLQKLWETRERGVLSLHAYKKLGGIKGALEQQAQELYDSLDPTTQECARWIFLNLTKIGDGTEDTRRRVTKSDLIVAKYPAELVEKTLQKLTAAKLVVINLDKGIAVATSRSGDNPSDEDELLQEAMRQEATVEVIHEILIRHWSTLRWWLEENRARLRLQRQIEQAAILWRKNQQQSDFLFRGIRLAAAEVIYFKYNDELTEVAQQFITACLDERLKQERKVKQRLRRTQITAAVLGVLGIATTVFAGLAYRQQLITQLKNITAMNAASEALLLSNQQLESLITSLKAGNQLQQLGSLEQKLIGQDNWQQTKIKTAATLQQAIYGTQEVNRLQSHSQKVNAVAYSSDGNLIATASDDNTIKIWSSAGELLDTLSGHNDRVTSLSFKPNLNSFFTEEGIDESSYILISGSADTTAILWRIENKQGRQIKQFTGHTDWITDVLFSNSIIATASRDSTIKLWDEAGALITTLSGHQGWVNRIELSQSYLVSSGEDGKIIFWEINPDSGKQIKTIAASEDSITDIAISSDQKTVVAASDYGEVSLWNIKDSSLIDSFVSNELINHITFSPDNQLLATATDNGKIEIYSENGILQQSLDGHNGGVLDIEFKPQTNQNSYTIASTGIDKTVRLWQIFSPPSLEAGGIYSIAISPANPDIFATAGFDGKIRLWLQNQADNSQELISTLAGHKTSITYLQYSPNGKILASASSDNTIKLWDTEKGNLITTLVGHQAGVNSISFSQDGTSLISGSEDRTVKIWDTKSNTLITSLTGHTDAVKTVAISPDNKLIATAGYDNTIKLWHRQGKLLQTIDAHNLAITSLQFTLDGKTLASASWDNTIKLWRVEASEKINPNPLQTLLGHQDGVTNLIFSQDNQILASASADRTIKLWHTQDGKLLKSLQGHSSQINSIAFSKNDQYIISAEEQQGLFWWNLTLENLLEQGCHKVINYLEYNTNISEQDRVICQQ
ncbi:MAG TPA: caspase family protein [Xenococcaceae cyanobacterium]